MASRHYAHAGLLWLLLHLGSFARANPYYIVAPLSEMTNRVTAGMDYTRRAWTVHYRLAINDSTIPLMPAMPLHSNAASISTTQARPTNW